MSRTSPAGAGDGGGALRSHTALATPAITAVATPAQTKGRDHERGRDGPWSGSRLSQVGDLVFQLNAHVGGVLQPLIAIPVETPPQQAADVVGRVGG